MVYTVVVCVKGNEHINMLINLFVSMFLSVSTVHCK